MKGKLTTHVLDTSRGCPAANITITLERLDGAGLPVRIATIRTNADGRTDAALLEGESMIPGIYIVNFAVGDYFGASLFDVIPVRIRIEDSSAHYHVPLLCSPWAYSIYRGS